MLVFSASSLQVIVIMTNNYEDIDYKFLDIMRADYPALYKMDSPEYSNRDIVANSWIGFCKEMGNISEEAAKDWWKRLVAKYTAEKKLRDAEETTSGISPVKRERYHLYELMRDMLASSRTPRPSITNYNPSMTSNNIEVQSKCNKNPQYYDYQSASGRGRQKQLQLDNLIKQIDMTIHEVQQASTCLEEDDCTSSNRDIGNLILLELNRMGNSEANEKKRLIAKCLFRCPKSD